MFVLRKDEVEWFNRRYATLEINGDFCVMRIEDGALYKVTSFTQSLAPKARDYLGERVQLAPYWLQHKDRRHYPHGIEFDPSKPPSADEEWPLNPPSRFNLWRGFAVDPAEADVEPFLSFVRDVLCNNDDELLNYVMAWLADLVQNPGEKPGTALVLRGDQGIGKSFFASCIGAMLGEHFIELNHPQYLVGRFTHHLRARLVVYADEGSFSGVKASSKLKNIITSDQLMIEQKFHSPYQVKNHIRVIISGNYERLIKAAHDERRFVVTDVNARRKADWDYWEQIFAWRDNNGAEALLDYLLRYEHSVNLREIPRTKALLDHKLASLDEFDRWYLDALQAGQLAPTHHWTDWHPAEELVDAFLVMTGTSNSRGRASATQVGMWLSKRVHGVKKGRPTIHGKQTWLYRTRFPGHKFVMRRA